MQEPSHPQETFADRLSAAMEARGVNNKELAEMVNADTSSVSRWVNGKTKPEGPGLSYVADRLGVSVEWLLHGRASQNAQSNPLARARLRAGMSIKQLAQATGYQIGVLQAVEQGARASEKMIEAICNAIPGANKEELMSGSDSPTVVSESGSDGTYGSKPNLTLPPGTKGRYVPLLSWAQAGHYDLAHTDEAYTGDGVLALDVDDAKAFAVEIEGDSMAPQLMPGDRVIVAPSWTPRAGDTVIARTVDGDVYCKLYARSGGKIVLMSANVNHPPREFSPDEIAWIYPVAQVTKNLRRR